MVYSKNAYLTLPEMTVNANYIASAFTSHGWSKNSIAGMLGNMQVESTINPGIWQNLNEGDMSGGYGLVQWTPASNLIDWANGQNLPYDNMDTQIDRIVYELDNGLQWIATSQYPLSFEEFTQSTRTPEYLASAFLKNYERAGVEKEKDRQDNARYWYDRLDWSGDWSGGGSQSNIEKDLIILWLTDALNGWKY